MQGKDIRLTIADQNHELLAPLYRGNSLVDEVVFDVSNEEQLHALVSKADVVISMLPARFHYPVALKCVELRKHMVTASYISPEMQELDAQARNKGVMLLNELGVDPGIDHMSAMRIIDDLKSKGATMLQFESFTGGLLAPESENNPWKYKFTWNPRNVVVAGQGGAVKFLQESHFKYIPYHMLFRRTEIMDIEGFGRFEGYPNRDSLKYMSLYGLEGIRTLFRGTLRRPGFCKAWDVFVKLGITDDTYVLEDSETLTHRDFINKFLAFNPTDSVELKLMHYLKIDQDSDIMEKLEWLGIFKREPIGIPKATPAKVLEHILKKKWTLDPNDKDMIVMRHKFGYELNGETASITSSMVALGENPIKTAMAKTVGLPVAITVKHVLEGTLNLPGVQLPVIPELYNPILDELEKFGIRFKEEYGPYVDYCPKN